jgi:hypothetical protein
MLITMVSPRGPAYATYAVGAVTIVEGLYAYVRKGSASASSCLLSVAVGGWVLLVLLPTMRKILCLVGIFT